MGMKNGSAGWRFHDAHVFLSVCIRDPRRIGSLSPSSNALADLITAEIARALLSEPLRGEFDVFG